MPSMIVDDIWMPCEDIAIEAQVDGAGAAAGDFVAAHAGVVKAHLPGWKRVRTYSSTSSVYSR
jgi:hypothetical protein